MHIPSPSDCRVHSQSGLARVNNCCGLFAVRTSMIPTGICLCNVSGDGARGVDGSDASARSPGYPTAPTSGSFRSYGVCGASHALSSADVWHTRGAYYRADASAGTETTVLPEQEEAEGAAGQPDGAFFMEEVDKLTAYLDDRQVAAVHTRGRIVSDERLHGWFVLCDDTCCV
jgi:hypothetical protein